MTDSTEKIKSRLLTWDTDAWNHRLRMVVLTPILILAGGIASIVLQIELTHYGYTVPFGGVLTAVAILLTLLVGYVVLALVD